MGRRYRTEVQGDFSAGDMPDPDWTRWVAPVEGYRMACCDCGLVHELQFAVHAESNRIMLRARRDNRATGQRRRRAPYRTPSP